MRLLQPDHFKSPSYVPGSAAALDTHMCCGNGAISTEVYSFS